jgi:hypothetical protein
MVYISKSREYLLHLNAAGGIFEKEPGFALNRETHRKYVSPHFPFSLRRRG